MAMGHAGAAAGTGWAGGDADGAFHGDARPRSDAMRRRREPRPIPLFASLVGVIIGVWLIGLWRFTAAIPTEVTRPGTRDRCHRRADRRQFTRRERPAHFFAAGKAESSSCPGFIAASRWPSSCACRARSARQRRLLRRPGTLRRQHRRQCARDRGLDERRRLSLAAPRHRRAITCRAASSNSRAPCPASTIVAQPGLPRNPQAAIAGGAPGPPSSSSSANMTNTSCAHAGRSCLHRRSAE